MTAAGRGGGFHSRAFPRVDGGNVSDPPVTLPTTAALIRPVIQSLL